MKIMIGTPAYGGLVYTRYLISLLPTLKLAQEKGIGVSVYTIENESLITRARNTIANDAMNSPDIEKLLFIDADISWTPEQFLRIVTSDKLLIGGTYPVKKLPPTLNFNPPLEHLNAIEKTSAGIKKYAEQHGKDGVVEVLHLPTGFMCIDVSVLHFLKTKVRAYYKTESEKIYDFFQTGVRGMYYESEDWFFSSLAKDHGIPAYLDTTVVLDHTGTYTYSCKETTP